MITDLFSVSVIATMDAGMKVNQAGVKITKVAVVSHNLQLQINKGLPSSNTHSRQERLILYSVFTIGYFPGFAEWAEVERIALLRKRVHDHSHLSSIWAPMSLVRRPICLHAVPHRHWRSVNNGEVH